MSKLEIACVVVGTIVLFSDGIEMKGNFTEKETFAIMTKSIITKLISGAMIILPLYFRFWR